MSTTLRHLGGGSYPRMTSFKDPVPIDEGAPTPQRRLAYLGRAPRT
jgi:hypothetical protein